MKARAITVFLSVSLFGSAATSFAQQEPRGPDDGLVERAWDSNGGGGPVPHRDWHRGERVPPDYRGPNYVVDDWRSYGLPPPPPGYNWVGVNGDYVLVAIATGVISNILLAPPR